MESKFNHYNYYKVCQNLLKNLKERPREIIVRRFCLKDEVRGRGVAERETLESIGKTFGITRERVRQIEFAAFAKLKPKIKEYRKIFQHFTNFIRKAGGLKREDILLFQLGGKNYQNEVFFLLSLGESFQKFSETKEFYSFWTINSNLPSLAKKTIDSLYNKLEKIKKPLPIRELKSLSDSSLSVQALQSFLEISKNIQKNKEGLFGLKNWPEINPRGIRDKVYLVFKKIQTPLHFTKIADFIGSGALVQTVHNELIKDPRFVLIGRGTYALKEWGYEEGNVQDIILKILREAQRPLSKEELLEEVSKQRLVKKNTILLNLNNKKYFSKDSQGKYIIRES